MSEKNTDPDAPVKVKARRLMCTNSKFDVHFDAIEGAGGLAVPDYLVLEPKTKAPGGIGGVCVLPVLADGSVALLKMYRYPLGAHCWEGPVAKLVGN